MSHSHAHTHTYRGKKHVSTHLAFSAIICGLVKVTNSHKPVKQIAPLANHSCQYTTAMYTVYIYIYIYI